MQLTLFKNDTKKTKSHTENLQENINTSNLVAVLPVAENNDSADLIDKTETSHPVSTKIIVNKNKSSGLIDKNTVLEKQNPESFNQDES